MATRKTTPLERLRAICLALPDTSEKLSHGVPIWLTPKRNFAVYAPPDTHLGKGRPCVWVFSTQQNQEFMIAAKPERFFSPPYVGPSGWIGIYLDGRVSWREVAEVLEDGHRASQIKKPKAPRRK